MRSHGGRPQSCAAHRVPGLPHLRPRSSVPCYSMTAREANSGNLATATARKRSPASGRASAESVTSGNAGLSHSDERSSEESLAGQSSLSEAPDVERRSKPDIPKGSRVALKFPSWLEHMFAGLDDALIPYAQNLWENTLLRYSSMGATTLTAIETALPAPGILYALGGRDAAAGLCASMLLVLAVVSQIPKKFIWRPRPWMAGRAKPHRRDNTSSFPSRAVVCGVVFTWLLCASIAVMDADSQRVPRLSTFAFVALAAAIASVARVACGAHYPSDCLCGFFLGLAVLNLGGRVEALWLRAGSAALTSLAPNSSGLSLSSGAFTLAHPEAQVGASAKAQAIVISSFADLTSKTPSLRMLGCIVASYVLTLTSIAGFWVKCSYVYGLLLSVCTFRFVFLAPAATGVTIAPGRPPASEGDFAIRIIAFSSLLAFGMATRGKKGAFRIATFTLIYFGSMLAMLWFRIA